MCDTANKKTFREHIMWYHVHMDLEKYSRRLKGGGRGYFLKFGRKNVKIFEWAYRKMHTVKRYVFDKNKMDEHIMKQKLSEKERKSLYDIMTNKKSKDPNNVLYGLHYHKDDLTLAEKEIIKQLHD